MRWYLDLFCACDCTEFDLVEKEKWSMQALSVLLSTLSFDKRMHVCHGFNHDTSTTKWA